MFWTLSFSMTFADVLALKGSLVMWLWVVLLTFITFIPGFFEGTSCLKLSIFAYFIVKLLSWTFFGSWIYTEYSETDIYHLQRALILEKCWSVRTVWDFTFLLHMPWGLILSEDNFDFMLVCYSWEHTADHKDVCLRMKDKF